jgi:rhodanese-related sulfurtransferase
MTDLITKRYAYKTELWDLIDKHRKHSPLGEEKAKKIPAVKFLKSPAVVMSDEEYNKLTAAHEHEAADFKKRNVSKALIEGLEFDDGVTLIDCRTVNEVAVWGILEGAKIVPIHDMWEGFKMHPALFEAEFGFRKPRQYDKIVFYCHHGPRSLMAAQFAWFMGWRNVYTFKEGYYHWAKQYSKILRSWFEHDERTGNDRHRQIQFIIGREISRDIAKEVNPRISKEVESLMIDQTRSRGTVKAIACSSRALDPSPTPFEKLLPEAEAQIAPNLEDVFLPTPPGYQQDVLPDTPKAPEIPELPPGMKLPPGMHLPLPPGPAKPRRVDDMSKPALRYAGNYYDVVTAPSMRRSDGLD